MPYSYGFVAAGVSLLGAVIKTVATNLQIYPVGTGCGAVSPQNPGLFLSKARRNLRHLVIINNYGG